MAQNDIFLLTTQSVTVNAVSAAIRSQNGFTLVGVCPDLPALVTRLEQSPASLVLVDIDPNPHKTLSDLDAVVNRFLHSRFIALTDETSSEVVLKAMQVGVRYAQAKNTIPSNLTHVLHNLAPGTPATHQGKIFTVLSASGGCGATTLVVNLANELQVSANRPVLVVDLDYHYGAVSSYLDLKGQYSVAEVLGRTGCIDRELLYTTAVRHSNNLHVLMSPASVDLPRVPVLDSERLGRALDACQQGYAFTVIDAPRVSAEVMSVLGQASDAVWIVFQPMVKDIAVAKAILSALVAGGVAPEKIRPVMNRYRKWRQTISLAEAQKALGRDSVDYIRNDYRNAARGINYGQPLAYAAPRSALRRDLLTLAGQVLNSNSGGNGKWR